MLWVLLMELTGRGQRSSTMQTTARPGSSSSGHGFGLAFVFALMFGFEYGLPLFVLVYALANKINWPAAILVTVIQWAVITGVFGLLMEVPWPEP